MGRALFVKKSAEAQCVHHLCSTVLLSVLQGNNKTSGSRHTVLLHEELFLPQFNGQLHCCCVENHLSRAQREIRSQLQLLPSELFDKQLCLAAL